MSANLARELGRIEPAIRRSRWEGYEHTRGWGVMSLPFSSGHNLGLRVFPESDFAPYVSVWHRTPDGGWTIHNDGPSLDTTCPRIWGPALRHADLTRISVEWTGPRQLRVEMQKPRLVWTLSLTATPLLRALNAVNASLPNWTWTSPRFRRVREWIAKHLLGIGDLRLAFAAPTGQAAVVLLEELYFIDRSRAVLEGEVLGVPVEVEENPSIGGVPLPRRPTFVVGEAQATIRDPAEHRRTRESVRSAALEAMQSFHGAAHAV